MNVIFWWFFHSATFFFCLINHFCFLLHVFVSAACSERNFTTLFIVCGALTGQTVPQVHLGQIEQSINLLQNSNILFLSFIDVSLHPARHIMLREGALDAADTLKLKNQLWSALFLLSDVSYNLAATGTITGFSSSFLGSTILRRPFFKVEAIPFASMASGKRNNLL